MAAEPTIKVYGSPISTATQRVFATLYEKELEFEFIKVDLRSGEQKKEPFISLNPFCLVPAFQEGDLTLFESRAITEYIAEKYKDQGTQLTPVNPETKAVFGLTTDAANVAANEAKLNKVLDVYESRLSSSKYLGGDRFSLADLHHIPNVHCLVGTPTKKIIDSHPKVGAWIADVTARPAWSKVVALMKQ
ncbi:Glutathione S-transferase PARB [Linum grandiflorum]